MFPGPPLPKMGKVWFGKEFFNEKLQVAFFPFGWVNFEMAIRLSCRILHFSLII